MSTKVQKTTTLTIDNATYNVSDLNGTTRTMVDIMDEWRQREADIGSDLLLVRAALRDIQSQIVAAVSEQLEQKGGKDSE